MSEQPAKLSRRQAIGLIGGTAATVALGLWIAAEESNRQTQSDTSATTTTEQTPTTSARAESPSGEQLTVADFVTVYTDYAHEVEAQFGIDHRVVLAQSYIETGGASSELATEANAFFGIKAKDDWNGARYLRYSPEELSADDFARAQENGARLIERLPNGSILASVSSEFRQYDTVLDSFLDYGDRITTSGYYDDAVAVRDDPLAYIEAMGSVYATDSGYAEKVIEKYHEILALG